MARTNDETRVYTQVASKTKSSKNSSRRRFLVGSSRNAKEEMKKIPGRDEEADGMEDIADDNDTDDNNEDANTDAAD